MPDANRVDLPWLFATGFFPSGPERDPSPDLPVLVAGRWAFRPAPPLPFRIGPNEAEDLARLAAMRRRRLL